MIGRRAALLRKSALQRPTPGPSSLRVATESANVLRNTRPSHNGLASFSSQTNPKQASPATAPSEHSDSHSHVAPWGEHSSERKTNFTPYSYASGSPLTRLPTPLPPDVADKQAQLRRSIFAKSKQELDFSALSKLSFGDLSSLTMTNADETFYPASKSVEHIGILKACLGTGLVTRAHKLFSDLRNQAQARTRETWELRTRSSRETLDGSSNKPDLYEYESPIEIWTYNSMLQAYLRKAYQDESLDSTDLWLNRAWDLWRDMENASEPVSNKRPPSADLQPNASTFAIMIRGIVALQRSRRYPASAPTLESIIAAAKRMGVSYQSIFESSVFLSEDAEVNVDLDQTLLRVRDQSREGEPDALLVLQHLSTAASQLGDTAVVHELDVVQRFLQGQHVTNMAESAKLHNPLEGVPELRPVLSTSKAKRDSTDPAQSHPEMPFNLVSLKDNLSAVQNARMTISDPYERQRWLEHSALEAARKRLEHSAEKLEELGLQTTGALQSKQLQTWMWDWYNKLQTAIKDDIKRIEDNESAIKKVGNAMEQQILPFLKLLPTSKIALITILELMRMAGHGGVSDGMKTTRALLQVGRAVEHEYHADVVRKNPQIFKNAQQAQQMLRKKGLIDFNARREIREWQKKMEDEGVISQIPKWTQVVRARVGAHLVQKLLHVATVNRKATDRDGVLWEEDQPAFYSTYQYLGGKKLGVIKLNDAIAKRLDKDSVQETLHPRHLPMLVPPKSWTTHDSGGYYSVRQSAMRFKDSAEQGSYLRAASDNGDLDTILAALDVLGSTAWKINRPIFDVMLQVWNSGKDTADMPPVEVEVPEPTRPLNYDTDIKARAIYLQRLKLWNQQRASNHSQRCDVNYKLEIARAFLGEKFYFPHNIDFRGRAYPMPPHLNHIGNDLCRGLLMFAEAKPLGEVGLRWLRIHLANVFGYDKASFAEREQFAKDHEADIRDSVENPLNGNRWWLKADDPWQCLATCMELKAAMEHPDGPEAFESSLPVHQDGTCNGLQHYAALGGDLHGAKQVNLSGGDRPADVYTGVADLVIKALDEDAAKGERLAQVLQGKVTRKVVKQTVMTTVYGVTFVGAKNQVMRQLADRGDVPVEDLFQAASYLAKVIMSCIGDLFQGAQKIQDWLSASAKMIAKSIPPERVEEATRPYEPLPSTVKRAEAKGHSRDPARADRIMKEQMTSVIWTTALGLPVVQPYRKVKKRQVSTAMQSVFIQDPLSSAEVSPSKQASAFPPNFIHSLDATHMILTALECHAVGLTFASVHDSYWTHAADIETMSEMIRDTFVRLHNQDILGRLRTEFLQRYQGYKVPVVSLNNKSLRQSARAVKEKEDPESVHVIPAEQLEQLNGTDGEVVLSQEEKDTDAKDDEEHELSEDEADLDSEATIEAEAEEETPPKRRGKKSDKSWEQRFKAKFVDLEDILPPIPAKGSFDVNEIKRSLYFFS